MDKKLLKATNRAAKRQRMNRSELIRQALERHLKYLRDLELEELDRRAYLAQPQTEQEYRPWEEIASWPPG
jgi:metal-responsive CopG/Arc/MetJ family transcriptional regulator